MESRVQDLKAMEQQEVQIPDAVENGDLESETPTMAGTENEKHSGSEDTGVQDISMARLSLTLSVLWFSVAFPILDETMIATLLGPISTSFNSFSQLSWIATTYLIGMAAINPVIGHLTDIFGRRNGLVLVNAIFIVGTLICGLSPKLWVLLLGRAIAGVGGGGMNSITAFIEADLVPLRTRGITEGLGGLVYGVAIAVGGLFGGGLNDAIGWKWAFLIQVPVIAVATVAIWFLIRIPRKRSSDSNWQRVDYVGGTAIIIAVVFLQLGLNSGAISSLWSTPLVEASLPIAAVAFVVFLLWDIHFAKEPLIPIRMLRRRNMLFSNIFYFFALMSYFSIEFYVPIYLQMLGHSTTATGLRFLPQAAGAAVATLVVGLVIKWTGKYYWVNVAAQTFAILGSGLLLTLETTTPQWCIFVFLGLTGIGWGSTWITVMMGVLSSVPDDQQAMAQSAGFTVRSIGMCVGLTISTSVFQHLLRSGLQSAFQGQMGGDVLIRRLTLDFNALQNLDASQKLQGQEAYMGALHIVFWMTTAESMVAAVASLLMSENELSTSLTS